MSRVAILTPARLDRPDGDSLRPRAQALGLWEIGFRDFVVYSRQPDPTLPFAQERIDVSGPAQLIRQPPAGFELIHAHQNAGLFVKDRLWVDMHGLAPVESVRHLQARPWRPRAWAHFGLTWWATRRLLARAERIVCASASIERGLRCRFPAAPPTAVLNNCLDPEDYTPIDRTESVVGVVGSFTSRWGRPAFEMALRVARRCPGIPFRLIGSVDDRQRRQASDLNHVKVAGWIEDEEFDRLWREVSIALLPYPAWCVGGGARQKLLRAAASAQSIVSTPAGVEGFEGLDNICLGRTDAELANHIATTLSNQTERQSRGLALREYITQNHHIRTESTRLAELYTQHLR